MKNLFYLLAGMLLMCQNATAQVKTYVNVTEDETKSVNASYCFDQVGSYYQLWVRYDYFDRKALKTDAKRDRATGIPVRGKFSISLTTACFPIASLPSDITTRKSEW